MKKKKVYIAVKVGVEKEKKISLGIFLRQLKKMGRVQVSSSIVLCLGGKVHLSACPFSFGG